MADITITLESICAGGGHATIGYAVNGAKAQSIIVDVSALTSTDDDVEPHVRALAKLLFSGKTDVEIDAIKGKGDIEVKL